MQYLLEIIGAIVVIELLFVCVVLAKFWICADDAVTLGIQIKDAVCKVKVAPVEEEEPVEEPDPPAPVAPPVVVAAKVTRARPPARKRNRPAPKKIVQEVK